MPFPWMYPTRHESFVKKIAGRFDQMLRAEIEQRARLLMNLGVARDAAVKRLQDRMKWDFEATKLPALYKDVAAIVDRVYRREHP